MIASKEEVLNELNKFTGDTKAFDAFTANMDIFKCRWFIAENLRDIPIEEILSIVSEKVIKRKRKWYKTKTPDFEDFFRMACISEIKNTWRSKNKKSMKKDEGSEIIESKIIDISNENELYQEKNEIFCDDFIQMLEKEKPDFDGEEFANICYNQLNQEFDKTVFLYMNEGKKENEIAKELEVDVKEIYKSNKRIKRIVRPLLEANLDIKITRNNKVVFSL